MIGRASRGTASSEVAQVAPLDSRTGPALSAVVGLDGAGPR